MIYLIKYKMHNKKESRTLWSRIKRILFPHKNSILFLSIVSCFLFLLSWFWSAQFFWWNSDFLEQVFSPSKSQEQVINIGNSKQAVGNEVLRPSTTIQLWGQWGPVAQRDPLLVRITKFLLRLTIVLSISMTIYAGIRYMLAVWSEEWTKNARQHLLYIVWWILLAMMSVGIIILLQSITFSSLAWV